jgi:cell division protease FtsH
MYTDPIFPLKYELVSGVKTGPILSAGGDWQIIKSTGLAKKILVASLDLSEKWLNVGLLDNSQIEHVRFGDESYDLILSDDRILAPTFACPEPNDKFEAVGFATAMRRTRTKEKNAKLSGGIYCEKYVVILPVPFMEEVLTDDVLLGSYLSGGVSVSCFSERRLLSLVRWLTKDDLGEICSAANLRSPSQKKTEDGIPIGDKKKAFRLIGRPELEAFFRDHIIDIIENRDRYKKLGIEFPSAVILYGPPGCGKTFAVEALVEYLDLPSFAISSGSIGSPYIHQTSMKIANVFDDAIKQSPSIIVIDEMEAYLSERAGEFHSHKVEEVAEFLRGIPEALKNNVLIIGMTNMIEKIDPSILRRGRFDHVIKIDMPTETEVESLLHGLFSERPCEENIKLQKAIALLSGRPLSDASFLVREAARITAKTGKSKIDNASIEQALKLVVREKDAPEERKIGFVRDK